MKFHIDLLSFLLGFLLASLGWFLLSRVRSAWPAWRVEFTRRINEIRERNLSGLENTLRQDTIERAQRQHLAARMFPLEDILVKPRLLANPSADDPDQQTGQVSVIHQLIPCLPDQPLLPSMYGYPSFSVDEALNSGQWIAVIARPGAGKTVALADFAIRIARRQCLPALNNLVPLYLHVHELGLQPNQNDDSLVPLQKAVSRHVLVIYQRQVDRFLRSALSAGRAVIILDGVDELPPQQLADAAAWLKSLRASYSNVRVLTTGEPAFLDGLLSAGLIPLALACWRPDDARYFVRRWKEAWDRAISPQLTAANGRQPVSSDLLEQWLVNRPIHLTPLEWAVQTWGLFAGDVSGPLPEQAIEACVRRVLPDQAEFEILAHLASHLIQAGQSAIPAAEAGAHAGAFRTVGSTGPGAVNLEEQPVQPVKKIGDKTRPLSAGVKIIDSLTSSGLLSEHPDGRVSFSQPAIAGFMASRSANLEALQETQSNGLFCWSVQMDCLRYMLAQGNAAGLVDQLLVEDHAPLQPNLSWLCSFLSDATTQSNWKNKVMRAAVQYLQDENAPVTGRACLVSALCGSNDASITALLRQLLAHSSPSLRGLAALGTGALRDTKAVDELITLLGDPEPSVRYAACLALTDMPTERAGEAAVAALEGDEDLRQVAAEALASIGPKGHQILLAALDSPDILMRRAAVFGLSRVNEAWVYEALEKVAIEDAQWVVRNLAAQALESFNQPKSFLPRPLPPPSEAGWLIQFASRSGESVPRGQSSLPILKKVMEEGNPVEQRAAMTYLRRSTDPGVINQICEIACLSTPISDSAAYALWWMAASGVQLPGVNVEA